MELFFLLLSLAGTIGGSFLVLFLLWVLVTGFQRAKKAGQLTPITTVIGYVLYVVGYAWDVWCNVLCNVVFLDIMRELTVSDRLRRLVQDPPGWRKLLAIWFARTLINPFSNGEPHIKIP